MTKDEVKTVKLMRCPIDTHCGDSECGKPLPFGVWVYFNPQSNEAICPECAVKRGWSAKQRVKKLIEGLELREDIKALRKQRKIELDALTLLKEKIDVHRLAERDLELEKQIVELMATVQDYLRHCATPEEKDALNKVFETIRDTQKLQKKVREQVQNQLFLIERKETAQKKKRQPVFV